MAAITTAVNRQRKGVARTRRFLMAVSTTIPKGALVSVGAATGTAINAVSGAVDPIVGVAAETVTSPGSGATYIQVEFDASWLFAASSITQAMVGDVMLVIDNNTVDDISAGSAAAGLLEEFVSTTSGWVFIPGLTGKHAV